jgi:hypothetical protein
MDIPHNTPPNKHILHSNLPISNGCRSGGYKMGILFLFQDSDIVEFDVEELVDGFENAFYCKIILEFHCDFLVYQCLEEGVEYWPLAKAKAKARWTYAFGDGLRLPRGTILGVKFHQTPPQTCRWTRKGVDVSDLRIWISIY